MRASLRNILIVLSLFYSSLHGQEYLIPDLLSIEDGLLSHSVSCVLIDERGFLWAGTKNGLNRYNGYRFRPFFSSVSGNGYPGIQLTLKLRTDQKGNLWVLNSGGFNSIDNETGEIRRYPVTIFDANFNRVSRFIDIYPSPDGLVWILSDRSLTALSADNTFTTWPLPPEMLQNATTPTALAADNRGNVWIGTNHGLILFSVNQKVFKEIVGAGVQGLLSNNDVTCLYIDSQNFLWVGTRLGLNYIDPVDYEFYPYYPSGTHSNEPSNNILSITGTPSGEFLMATGGGIIRFDPASLQFENLYPTVDTTINSVAIDLMGNIWAATDLGILKIRKSRLPFINVSSRSAALKS
ncbi:MAG TPA: two-component regulator propeller domain-containing protein, partial [Bacteroidales bacterium]|nr:two-component regulator propeller domain-containing protein [Bacteroidales bacterium]